MSAACNSGCTGTILTFLPLPWRTRKVAILSAPKCVIIVIITHLEHKELRQDIAEAEEDKGSLHTSKGMSFLYIGRSPM